ncbi:unnamed protein product [Cunninghamella echinulata]
MAMKKGIVLLESLRPKTQQITMALKIITFQLEPSQQIASIRNIIASRKRKLIPIHTTNIHDEQEEERDLKKKKEVYDDMINGLPSPPVESPLAEFPPLHDSTSVCSLEEEEEDDTPPLTPNTHSTIVEKISSSTSSSITSTTTTEDNDASQKPNYQVKKSFQN